MGAGGESRCLCMPPLCALPAAVLRMLPHSLDHLEQPLVRNGDPAAPPAGAAAALLGRRLLIGRLCLLRCLRCPQQVVVEVGDLGALEQQVLDERLEQGRRLQDGGRDWQRQRQRGLTQRRARPGGTRRALEAPAPLRAAHGGAQAGAGGRGRDAGVAARARWGRGAASGSGWGEGDRAAIVACEESSKVDAAAHAAT